MFKFHLKKIVIATLFIPFSGKCEEKFIVEANPLLLINQGIGLNIEYFLNDHFSIGKDLEYFHQVPYNYHNVTAQRTIFSFVFKSNYYILDNLYSGPFLGFKIYFTNSNSTINDPTATSNSNMNYIAPVLQAGYRFLSSDGITLSAYVGGGLKLSNDQFPDSKIPNDKKNDYNWQKAQSRLNKDVSLFLITCGLTIGYLF